MNSNASKQLYDCLVIGGGVVGLMAARVLLHAGLKVAVIEKGTTGMESSWAGGGILSPLSPWHDTGALQGLIDQSLRLYPGIVEELQTNTGIDPEWQKSGMLVFAIDTREEELLRTWAVSGDIPLDVCSREQLSVLEPGVNTRFDRAFYLPEIFQVRNPFLLKALHKYLVNRGVDIHEQTEVKRLLVENNRMQGVGTTRGNFLADITVLATGAWGSCLLDTLEIKPVRGQMLCYQARPGYLNHILLKNGLYIIPRRDGHLLVGSTLEDVGFDKSTTNEARTLLVKGAGELLPETCNFPLVGHWAGLRPATRTRNPYICAYPGIEGLYLNIGHYRNGLLLAPASATMLADIILKGKTVSLAGSFQFQPAAAAS